LTGPNRGGKSTALRAFVSSALLAHTYGCIIGHHSKLTPFKYIFASLKADDIPGSKSHFEREVDFTAQTLQLEGPTLVFIDELFHTTNPPDALLSCKVYCNKLWNRNDVVSVISTHLFELVETSDEAKVKKICCPATSENGKIIYKYGIENGMCKISSVSEILHKYGYDCA
jgi:DNA mismatch repair ATPase MutS